MKKMMWKTGSTLITLAAGWLLLSSPVRAEGDWGPCIPDGPVHDYHAVIDKTVSNPAENYAGKSIPGFYNWNLGGLYSAMCPCSNDESQLANVYYSGESTLPPGHTEGGVKFYKINENLEFAAKVFITGGTQNYFYVPFQNISNNTNNRNSCNISSQIYGSGSRGTLDLYIAKPFVGESIIPNTTLLQMYGVRAWNRSTVVPPHGSIPMATVTISGRVVVPQGCEMPAGYTTEIDFGDYNARDFKNRHGDMPVNARVIEKKLDFKCSNISDGVRIYLKLEANTNPDNPDAIDLGNPDIGAIVTRKTGTVLRPGTDDNVELDVGPLNGVDRDASVTLKAYPISTTGKIPQSGEFDGVATLSLEVE